MSMKSIRLFALPVLALICFAGFSSSSSAQVSINVHIGAEPVCPYGYFNYAPYGCAPFGYYGPQWFATGVFVGAGPWFHGPVGFHGYVNRSYDPHYGYHGPYPVHGEHADWGHHAGWEKKWHGNEYRTEYHHDNGNHYGQYKAHEDHGNHNGQYKDHDNHGNGKGHEDHDNGHGRGHN
jgi:hypothetical protein